MGERVAELLLRLLRVPPEPQVPVEARNVRVFRAAPSYFRYKLATWALTQLGALIGVFTATALSGENGGSVVVTLYRLGEIAAWCPRRPGRSAWPCSASTSTCAGTSFRPAPAPRGDPQWSGRRR